MHNIGRYRRIHQIFQNYTLNLTFNIGIFDQESIIFLSQMCDIFPSETAGIFLFQKPFVDFLLKRDGSDDYWRKKWR